MPFTHTFRNPKRTKGSKVRSFDPTNGPSFTPPHRLTNPTRPPIIVPKPNFGSNNSENQKRYQPLTEHMTAIAQVQVDAISDSLGYVTGAVATLTDGVSKALSETNEALKEVFTKLDAAKKAQEGSITDPVLKRVLAKLGLDKEPTIDIQLGNPAIDKEPYYWLVLWGELKLTKDQIINKYKLEGEVLQQYRRCMLEHYNTLTAEQRDVQIEKLVKLYRMLAYLYLGTPASGDVSEMFQLMEPSLIEARSIITELETKRLDRLSGGTGASAVFRASRLIDPTDLPVGTGDTVKSMRTKAARDDDDDDGPRKKKVSGAGGQGGGGVGGGDKKGQCRWCHKKMLKSKLSQHSSVCPKKKTRRSTQRAWRRK